MSPPDDPATGRRAVRVRILAPLREPSFRLLWSALAVSLLGDGVFLVAVAWQAYALDNRPEALAWVAVATSLPQLALLLLGGAVSDRRSRRAVLVASDLVRGAALAALAVAGWTGYLRLWHLCAAAAVIGGGTAFAAPAFDAIVPQLVTADQLQPANGLDQFLRPVTLRLLGPALGGLAVAALGSSTAFAADAASFVFSAWRISRITLQPRADGSTAGGGGDPGASVWADLGAGLRYVRGHVWLWGTFAAATLTYLLFLGPTEVLLPYVVKNQLHGSAGSLGLVLGSGGTGALVAAAIVGQRERVGRPVTFMYVTWAGATLAVVGYGVANRQWQLALTAVAVNALEAAGTVVWATLKQRLVPGDFLGRVSSIDWFVSTSLMPLSYLLTPLAVRLLGVRATLVAAGTAGAAVTLAFLFLPGMRVHDRPAAGAEPLLSDLRVGA
jgi:MFS family permease